MLTLILLEVALIILGVLFSVRERVKIRRQRDGFGDVLSGAKSTLLSEALTNMVATAGGLYLALIMVVTFLQIDIPDKVTLIKTPLDPLALGALIIAICQPFFEKLWYLFKKF